MSVSPTTRYSPDPERLSVLAATIALAYALTRFIALPAQVFEIQLPGFYLAIPISLETLMPLFVGLLTAVGADWLIRDHPLSQRNDVWQHALLPALAAWVIGVPLEQVNALGQWWAGLGLGAALLITTVIAEYIVLDTQDVRYPLASAWLTAIAYILFLVLAVTLRAGEARLAFVLPGMMLAGGLTGLRTLHLRLHGEWTWVEAGLLALLLGQITAAFHYWPLTPFAFGLIVLGVTYAITSLIGGLADGRSVRQSLLEPALALAAAILAAIWMQ